MIKFRTLFNYYSCSNCIQQQICRHKHISNRITKFEQNSLSNDEENIKYLNLIVSSSSSSSSSSPALTSHYFNNNLNYTLNYKFKKLTKMTQAITTTTTTQTVNYFAHSFIDRCSDKRKSPEWIREQQHSRDSVFVLFHLDKPFVTLNDSKNMYSLYKFNYEQIKSVLEQKQSICIFLGVEYEKSINNNVDDNDQVDTIQSPYSNPNIYNKTSYKSWFAIDIVNDSNCDLFKEYGTFFEGNFLRVMSIQDYSQASIIAQARSILCWLDRNKHCASCGRLNEIQDAGFKLSCINTACKSNDKLLNKHVPSNIHYPRVDPVAIMLIINPNKTHVLLGRKKQFPKNMFSCLAGFVEAVYKYRYLYIKK
jgi:NADH pyrophosphatase NudC (nudix superfamily)